MSFRIVLTLAVLASVLVGIVGFQNSESVAVQFLVWDARMPLIALLGVVTALGFLGGLLAGLRTSSGKRAGPRDHDRGAL